MGAKSSKRSHSAPYMSLPNRHQHPHPASVVISGPPECAVRCRLWVYEPRRGLFETCTNSAELNSLTPPEAAAVAKGESRARGRHFSGAMLLSPPASSRGAGARSASSSLVSRWSVALSSRPLSSENDAAVSERGESGGREGGHGSTPLDISYCGSRGEGDGGKQVRDQGVGRLERRSTAQDDLAAMAM